MIGQATSQTFVLDGPSWAPYAIAIGTCLTALVAGLTAYFGLSGIRQSHKDAMEKHKQDRDHALQARALHYLERYDGQHHVDPRVRLNTYFMIDPAQKDERINEWENMSYEEKLRNAGGLNFWEELSGMYNRDLVDREIIDYYFGSEAAYIWQRVSWFVQYQREQDPDAMIEMQRMCDAIRRKRDEDGRLIDPIAESTLYTGD